MKKFVNLPSKYRSLLKSISKILTPEDISNINKKTISYNKSMTLFNNINKLALKNECDPYDINRMIHYYKKTNGTINLLKKLLKIRNRLIISNVRSHKLWRSYIRKLQHKIKSVMTVPPAHGVVEKGVLKLLKKYDNNWLGYWTILNLSKRGDLKSINIFDVDDYDTILVYVGRKYKWKFKDKNEIIRLKSS